jgi:hypothetical protein
MATTLYSLVVTALWSVGSILAGGFICTDCATIIITFDKYGTNHLEQNIA